MKTLFWQKYPNLNKQLDQTRKLIEDELKILDERDYEGIYEAAHSIALGSGKLLRPALVYLFNDLGPQSLETDKVTPIASSMEILHFATLIHDDVIDNSPLRRHKPTIHSKFGSRQAIYTGDFLFTVFFDLLTKNVDNIELLRQNSNQMKLILLGELDQMKGNWNFNFKVEDYLNEVIGKTATLFGLSAINGMTLASGSELEIKNAYEFGINLGIAFQMADDLLDFGETKKTGKPNFEDLKNGVFSLPVILALQNDDGRLRSELEQGPNQDCNQVLNLITEFGAIAKTKTMLKEYLDQARENLDIFARSPQKDILLTLLEMIEKQIKK